MKKVLIVEDDKTLRDVYVLITKHAGYRVASARDGQDALVKLKKFKPDVILLDMMMPVKDGLEFLKASKIKINYPNISVVVLSNLSESRTVKRALKLGASEHLIKSNLLPINIIETIEKYTKPML